LFQFLNIHNSGYCHNLKFRNRENGRTLQQSIGLQILTRMIVVYAPADSGLPCRGILPSPIQPRSVLFPSGSTSLWRVTADVRKIAVCHVAAPRLVALGLHVLNKLRSIAADMLGLNGKISAAPPA
jgi:hypothetical protein